MRLIAEAQNGLDRKKDTRFTLRPRSLLLSFDTLFRKRLIALPSSAVFSGGAFSLIRHP